MRKSIFRKHSDRIGIISSVLCLVHCLALPIFLGLQPLAHQNLPEGWHFLDYIFLVMSVLAVYFTTYRMPWRRKWVFYLVLIVLMVGIFGETRWPWLSYLGYLGSLGLILMHLVNLRRFRRRRKIKPSVVTTSSF